jgi:hypothetical protein
MPPSFRARLIVLYNVLYNAAAELSLRQSIRPPWSHGIAEPCASDA